MSAREPRRRMRPLEGADAHVEERVVRRSMRQRWRIRFVARLRRWLRRFRRSIAAVAVLVVLAILLISQTGRGQTLALELAVQRARESLSGELVVGGVRSTSLLGGATLRDVRLTTSDGRPFLRADSVGLRYSIPAALTGGPPIRATILWGLDLEISKYSADQAMNLTRIAIDRGPKTDSLRRASARPFPLGRVGIRGGTVRILTPADEPEGVRVVQGPEGQPLRSLTFENLDLDVENATLSPGNAIEFEARLASFSSEVGILEEPLVLREAFGQVTFGAQGIRITDAAFRLPGTLARGEVTVGPRRVGAPWTFRSELETDGWGRLDDVRWVDARIPEGRFRGGTAIVADDGIHLDMQEMEVELEASTVSFDGNVHFADGMTVDGMRVRANPVVLGRLEPWLERELPVEGWLSGEGVFDGTLDDVDARGRVTFVPRGFGARPTTADFEGRLRRGAQPGAASFRATLNPLSYDVLEALLPGLPWQGAGSATVALDGPLRDSMRVVASLEHTTPLGLRSQAEVAGTVAHDSVGGAWRTDLDVDVQPLSLGLFADLAPELVLGGEVAGSVRVSGALEGLSVEGSLTSEEGSVDFAGALDATDPARGYRIRADARDLPVARLVGRAPERTRWTGSADVVGLGFALDSMKLDATLRAGPSRVGRMRVDTLATRLRVAGGVVSTDAFVANVGGIDLGGRGRLGLVEGRSGTAQVEFTGADMVGLRPLLMGVGDTILVRDNLTDLDRDFLRLQGIEPDTLPAERDVRLAGRVDGAASVTGHLGDFELGVILDVFDGRFRHNEVDTVRIGLTATGLPAQTGAWQVGASARGIVWENRRFERGGFEADMLRLDGDGRLELVRRPGEQYRAVGSFALDSLGGEVALTDASIQVDAEEWTLLEPGRIAWSDSTVLVDSVRVGRRGDDPMRATVGGRLARGGDSDFRIDVEGLHVEQVMHVLQLESPDLGGHVDIALEISGPAERPRIDGTFDILGPRFETVELTRVAGSVAYAQRRLAFDVEGWDGARSAVNARGAFPLDLALSTVEDRVVDGAPIDILIEADSLDAAVALSYVTSLEGVVGSVSGQVAIGGTPASPEPEGRVQLTDAGWSIEAIGVRHTGVSGALVLNPDRNVDVRLSATGPGRSDVTGQVRLDPFRDPRLDLTFAFQSFQAVDRADYEGAMSGSFTLSGSYRRPIAEGALTVEEGTIFVDELQRAAGVVDLSESFLFDMSQTLSVDTVELVSQPLFAGLGNPFFDNLRVDVDLSVPRGNWLRSIDTNAELSGELLVLYDRSADDFVLIGELEALRGSHRVLGRSFELDGGTVNFIGRPGLNPDLNIEASTRIRRPDDAPFRVQAQVGGTLVRPIVTLTSEETGLAEEDLVSYLVFGQPSGALGLRRQGAGSTIAQGLGTFIGGSLANQLGSAIAQELGALSLDYVSIQQGGAVQSLGEGGLVGDTQIELGRYVGDDLFLIMVLRPFDRGPQDQNTVAGVRVEWALTDDYNSEFFFEDRFLRGSSALAGTSSAFLQNEQVLGVFLFREWGYGGGTESPDR